MHQINTCMWTALLIHCKVRGSIPTETLLCRLHDPPVPLVLWLLPESKDMHTKLTSKFSTGVNGPLSPHVGPAL